MSLHSLISNIDDPYLDAITNRDLNGMQGNRSPHVRPFNDKDDGYGADRNIKAIIVGGRISPIKE